MPSCAPPSAATAWSTSRRTTGGRLFWASTNGSSRRSETPAETERTPGPDDLLFDACDRVGTGGRSCRFRDRSIGLGPVAIGRSLAPRPNLVALDHLVQRRRTPAHQADDAERDDQALRDSAAA